MTSQPEHNRSASGMWTVYLALFLLLVIALFFMIFFAVSSVGEGVEAASTLTAATYLDEVSPLLVNANPQNGAELVQSIGCTACHNGNIAPDFAGVALRAAQRRPPLTAVAYLYESITHPGAFTVEGYQANMPRIYLADLSGQQIGDIIAYLLTQTESPEATDVP